MADEATKQQKIGHFIVLDRIGKGGMGAVYKAEDPKLDRIVALKLLPAHLAADAEFVKRFKLEATTAAKLSHSHLVQVYAADEDNGTFFIAMEFVDGESLKQRMQRHPHMPPVEALAIAVYVADALRYAWNKAKIIHRDIKPDNILLSKDGEVKVADLGLAKSLQKASVTLTTTGMVMGSPFYISPEQAQGKKDLDFHSDIYSLGCTLFHMLAGQPPFEGEELGTLFYKHIHEPPPDLAKLCPDCPPKVVQLVKRMMSKDPKQRPPTYDALIAEMQSIYHALKRAPTQKAASQGRRTMWWVSGAAATVLLMVSGIFVAKSFLGTPTAPHPAAVKGTQQNQPTDQAAQPVTAGTTTTTAAPRQGTESTTASTANALKLLGNVYTNIIGAEMVYIPPGEFMMGSTKEEQAWARDTSAKGGSVNIGPMDNEGEQPRRTRIKQGFWLGRTQLTVRQWKEFIAATGYRTDAEKKGYADYAGGRVRLNNVKGASWKDPKFDVPQQDSHPVCCVSWNDAAAFCEWLTEQERKLGRLPASLVVRLPTEAEWEYACRAGTQAKYWWGESADDSRDRVNWWGGADGFEFTSPAGIYGDRGRNKFGLADMLGNVFEWCLDEYDPAGAHEECYKDRPGRHVLRGQSFTASAPIARCAYRVSQLSAYANNYQGFRICYGVDVSGAKTTTASTSPSATSKEGGIFAPSETRVTALTSNPKVGVVYTLNVGSNVTMELMGIPPGEFMLGSTKEEQAWAVANGRKEEDVMPEGEAPRKAAIKQGFWMGRTEVTVGQWKQFVKETGYVTDGEKNGASHVPPGVPKKGVNWRNPDFGFEIRDDHPVSCISWNDAMAFCDWLTERERKAGGLPTGQVVRLPTEAEWEYACRADTQTKFWWGDSIEDGKGRLNQAGKDDGFEFVAPVDSFGRRGRNRFGLTDMLGNVWEWCLDEYDATQAHEECYRGNFGTRVLRGGAFNRGLDMDRCASRGTSSQRFSHSCNSFRVCYSVDVSGTTTPTPSTSSIAAPKEGGILAPPETRVAALTTNPKVGEVFTLNVGNNVTMELMGIPPGEFMLGSTKEEQAWAVANRLIEVLVEGEAPRKASIKQGFWMGRTEVTVGQWKQFVKETNYVTDGEKRGESTVPQTWGRPVSKKGASWRNPGFGAEPQDNHPVCCMSWNDAEAFCRWLNHREQKAGLLAHDYVVRLPTEAEWEYACRAGTQTKFWWGESKEDGNGRLNWDNKKYEFVTPVDSFGERGRNPFGLADMLGNVWECCLDEYDATQAHEELWTGNPVYHVLRGGAFGHNPAACRCATRHDHKSDSSFCYNGFRVIVGVDVPVAKTTTASTSLTTAKRETLQPAAPVTQLVKPDTLEPGAIRLWDSPDKIPSRQGIHWRNNALVLGDEKSSGYLASLPRSRDAIIRAEVLMSPDSKSPTIQLRCSIGNSTSDSYFDSNENGYRLKLNIKMSCVELMILYLGKERLLGTWPLPRSYGGDEWIQMELRAIGNELTAGVDRKPLGTVHDTLRTKPGGAAIFAAPGYFRNIVYVPLDKPGSSAVASPTAKQQ